jgi:hypothetical protein
MQDLTLYHSQGSFGSQSIILVEHARTPEFDRHRSAFEAFVARLSEGNHNRLLSSRV